MSPGADIWMCESLNWEHIGLSGVRSAVREVRECVRRPPTPAGSGGRGVDAGSLQTPRVLTRAVVVFSRHLEGAC